MRQIELRKAVIAQLREGWSPEQIAGRRLGFEGRPVRVSHETIYAYIYGPDGQSKELARHLPSRRKNASQNTPGGPVAKSSHRIDRFINVLSMLKPAMPSVTGKAI